MKKFMPWTKPTNLEIYNIFDYKHAVKLKRIYIHRHTHILIFIDLANDLKPLGSLVVLKVLYVITMFFYFFFFPLGKMNVTFTLGNPSL